VTAVECWTCGLDDEVEVRHGWNDWTCGMCGSENSTLIERLPMGVDP
jgi:transcription elongation factor Elf1